MNGRIDGAPPLSCCWVLSVEILKMSLDSMQRSIVQLLLEACQHGLVLADVVDHRHNHSKGVLPWLQCYICPGKLEEDEDLLFVPDDAGLTDRKNIGGDRGHGEAEGDRPLQLALSHQLRLHFKSHQLDNVLQGLLGAMQQPAEAREEGWAIRRRHNFCIKELLDDQQLVRLPLVGVVRHHFEVQRLERVVRVD